MFAPDDTIVAIATAAGRGGIGVVRISGPDAVSVAGALFNRRMTLQPRLATFARLAATEGGDDSTRDEVIVTWFVAPCSYTGQQVVEISGHGSPVVLQGIVRRAIEAGARLAQPGEFTLRAFLNGKRDLIQAEAIADLVDAATPIQARVAFDQLEGTLTRRIREIDAALFHLIARLEASLDFPDEGYHFIEPGDAVEDVAAIIAGLDRLLVDAGRGRMIREGATVVIAGRTNVGKSSVFNALVGADRAIVTDVAGTTRDLITERVDLDGLLITLVDTAGSRDTADVVESQGVERAGRARAVADLVLVVTDCSEALTDEDRAMLADTASLRRVVVLNKSDRLATQRGPATHGDEAVAVSALTGDGIPELRARIARVLTGSADLRDSVAISNTRHVTLLRRARAYLQRVVDQRPGTSPEEVLLVDLQAAGSCFDEVVGVRTSEDVLQHIFERFCIGK